MFVYCLSYVVPMDLDVKMKAVVLAATFLIVSVFIMNIHSVHVYSIIVIIIFINPSHFSYNVSIPLQL